MLDDIKYTFIKKKKILTISGRKKHIIFFNAKN